jgi:GTP cyclohydrolase IA
MSTNDDNSDGRTLPRFPTVDEVRGDIQRLVEADHELRDLPGGRTGTVTTRYETAAGHIRKALQILGMECDGRLPSIERTPERWVGYLQEFFQPCDPQEILGTGFDAVDQEGSIHSMVIQTHIPYVACCEHHLLPFWGEAAIGYVPGKRVVGLSKMARLVDAVSHHRPGLQEAHTEAIADAMFDILESKGAMVVIKATHTCMSCRGIRAVGALTMTSCIRGVFRDVPGAREEFLSLTGLR